MSEPSTNPIVASPNRLKLGVFGANVSAGCSITDMPESLKVEWAESVAVARAAEAAGIEAVIPVARWKGMGGAVNFNHRNFETLTWAAGLAAQTETIGIFSTVHIPTVHPIRIAKEAATIDHISGGRFCLNMVAGWNETEFAMFGLEQREHDDRYDVAEEWLALCRRLWNESEEFDFAGTYFESPGAYSEPKPVQPGGPLLMSAGNSPRGRAFAAQHADVNFVLGPDIATVGAIAADVKRQALDDHGREVQVFGQGHIVCFDTQAEADAYYQRYVHERGDWEGARNMMATVVPNSDSLPAIELDALAESAIAGYGAIPLVGTPEKVVAMLAEFADAGLDGISVSWVDYLGGLQQFDEVLRPMLVDAGVRDA